MAMWNPASMLVNLPDRYKPVAALVVGAVILVAIVSIHGHWAAPDSAAAQAA